jgi:hypothetical protein
LIGTSALFFFHAAIMFYASKLFFCYAMLPMFISLFGKSYGGTIDAYLLPHYYLCSNAVFKVPFSFLLQALL